MRSGRSLGPASGGRDLAQSRTRLFSGIDASSHRSDELGECRFSLPTRPLKDDGTVGHIYSDLVAGPKQHDKGRLVPAGGGHRYAEDLRAGLGEDEDGELGQITEREIHIRWLERRWPRSVGRHEDGWLGLFVETVGALPVDGSRRPPGTFSEQRHVPDVASGKGQDDGVPLRILADLADELDGAAASCRGQRDPCGQPFGRGAILHGPMDWAPHDDDHEVRVSAECFRHEAGAMW